MDLLYSINQYLKGKLSFNQGVELYKQAGASAFILQILKTEDDYAHDKLRSELQKHFDRLNSVETKPKKHPAGNLIRQQINPESLPTHLRAEYNKLGNIIRNISFLHAKLEEKNSNGERYKLAAQIIELVTERRIIYSRCDYYVANGRDLPQFENNKTEVDLQKLTKFEALHKIQLLRVQRTKLKKLPARVNDYNKVCSQIKVLEKLVKKYNDAE